ncbi:hypothetical protein EAH81_17660 [Flavobacterium pectinovorum]|uniref:Uncharacterized protein n=1 Tax=Flavobacterium pectinovorum TaxID=29533 RepID=A0A502EL09_9FLAO|nr:hypothetical protein EAH81_17660 [Flavobacterium pectinovorum]
MQADMSSGIQAFRHSGIEVCMFSYNYVGRCACRQVCIPACKPAGSHTVKPAGIRAGHKVLQQSSITKKKKNIFRKENRKREKKKKKAI